MAPASERSGPVCRSCGTAIDPRDRYCPQCGRRRRSHRGGGPQSGTQRAVEGVAKSVQDLLYGVLGWFLVLLTVGPIVMIANGVRWGSAAQVVVGLLLGTVLLGGGVVLNPRFGRQLANRHSPTTFGRTRTVDHRVIDPGERCLEDCVACSESFDVGLVRRRRDETVVAGIPIYIHDVGFNHYCADCAETHVFGAALVDRDAIEAAAFSERLDATDVEGSDAGDDVDGAHDRDDGDGVHDRVESERA